MFVLLLSCFCCFYACMLIILECGFGCVCRTLLWMLVAFVEGILNVFWDDVMNYYLVSGMVGRVRGKNLELGCRFWAACLFYFILYFWLPVLPFVCCLIERLGAFGWGEGLWSTGSGILGFSKQTTETGEKKTVSGCLTKTAHNNDSFVGCHRSWWWQRWLLLLNTTPDYIACMAARRNGVHLSQRGFETMCAPIWTQWFWLLQVQLIKSNSTILWMNFDC